MRTLIGTMLVIFCGVAPAFAASGGIAKGVSILFFLFFGFVALVVVIQFIPGLMLFFSMLKGLFKATSKNGSADNDKK